MALPIPYTRPEFVKGAFLRLVDVRTLAKCLFAKPRLRGEDIKYLLDARFFLNVGVAKAALLAAFLCLYAVIASDGLYVGTTGWCTLA